jgi:hypothetical protein
MEGLAADPDEPDAPPPIIRLTPEPAPPAKPAAVAEEPSQKKAAAGPAAQKAPSKPKRSVADLKPGALDASTAPDRIEEAKTLDACVAWFFRQIKTRFTTAIVFLKEGQELLPWKWDAEMRLQTETPLKVGLDVPSLFRVSARTLKPYHGFVVDSPEHVTFFRSIGLKKPPAHVTAVPIIANKHYQGLFLCIGRDTEVPLEALEFVEMCADKTIRQIESTQSIFGSKAA